MLSSTNPKTNQKPSIFSGSPKRKSLSLNLHTMPQTITSHWTRWLVLGFVILGIFAIVSFLLYSFTS